LENWRVEKPSLRQSKTPSFQHSTFSEEELVNGI